MFERMDRDGDGWISREEHAVFLQQRGGRDGRAAAPGMGRADVFGRVDVRRDLDYAGTGNPRQTLDLLLPKDREPDARLPVIVFIHGGGWSGGNKAGGFRHLVDLVAPGEFIGATINYRLTDEASWPAQIHDCKAAIRFLRGNAEQFGIDPERIAVWGNSAGGHLASMLGTSGGVAALEGELGAFVDQSSCVTCVLNFCGPQNLISMAGQPSAIDRREGSGHPEERLLGGSIVDRAEAAAEASPVTWVSADDPPFLTAHGTEDRVVPFQQAEEIHAALVKAGVESHLVRMEGFGHSIESAELNRRIRAFLGRHLLDAAVDLPNEPVRR